MLNCIGKTGALYKSVRSEETRVLLEEPCGLPLDHGLGAHSGQALLRAHRHPQDTRESQLHTASHHCWLRTSTQDYRGGPG